MSSPDARAQASQSANPLSPQFLPNSHIELQQAQGRVRGTDKPSSGSPAPGQLSTHSGAEQEQAQDEVKTTNVVSEPLKSAEDASKAAPNDNIFAYAMANASAGSDHKHSQSEPVWDEKQEHGQTPEDGGDDVALGSTPDQGEESGPEIDHIMSQSGSTSPLKSPSSSSLPAFQYPPRSSSLTSLRTAAAEQSIQAAGPTSPTSPTLNDAEQAPATPAMTTSVPQPPMPDPDPEPSLPFDFHRFLEQLRNRTADPVAGYLRSFLSEFGKRSLNVHEQQKVISNFLAFIATKMAHCDVWRNVSDAEFDNAREGMEKLVMNRLYGQTFSPEIPAVDPGKTRRRTAGQPQAQGRRGQHQEDVERDEVLAQKVRIYSWVREEHLDMKPFSDKGRRFLLLAQQELSQVNKFRAPRDKIICILNCCKVLFGFLRNAQSDQSADSFIPLLIYTVLKTNPQHLVSNVQYILRFRNPDKLSGEAGYYMSSLMGAVQFIENLDRTNLTITDEEFEKSVEKAVSAIAERQSLELERRNPSRTAAPTPAHATKPRSKADPLPPLPAGEPSEGDAVSGLLRTIQKPLSSIGRIFSDDSDGNRAQPQPQPQPPSRRHQPEDALAVAPGLTAGQQRRVAAEEAAVKQASTEAAQVHNMQQQEHLTIVDTLSGMFPQLDRDVISDVVRQKEGRVGTAVDACLALSR